MVYMTITANIKPMFLSVQDLLPMTTNSAKDLLQKETTMIKASLAAAMAASVSRKKQRRGKSESAMPSRFMTRRWYEEILHGRGRAVGLLLLRLSSYP